jgi:hypothetical protein
MEATRLPRRSLVIIPDAHHCLNFEPSSPTGAGALLNIGAMKDAYHRLVVANRGVKVVLLCGDITLPRDLREEVLRLELPLPSRRELYVSIKKKLGSNATDEQIVRLSEEAAGMTLADVEAVLLRGRAERGSDDHDRRLAALRQAKRRNIARSPRWS